MSALPRHALGPGAKRGTRIGQRVVLWLLLAAAALPLAACGKVASPALPPGERSQYPRTYPSGDTQ